MLARLILRLSAEPQHQAAWSRGAEGEEHVARTLARFASPDVILLHDRRVPESKTNIDHVAIAPSGVWVIDTKRYRGKVAVRTPFFGEPKLVINGRDTSKLASGLAKQVRFVEGALAAAAPDIPVHGAFAIVDADLPLLRRLNFDGFPLLYPKHLAKRLSEPGPIPAERIREITSLLDARFPAA